MSVANDKQEQAASDVPNIDAPAIGTPTTDPVPEPFEVKFAARVGRLPPYMFGRINNSLYQKRRAGDDVIDLGMGNPSDPPDPVVVQKLHDASSDVGNHGYSKSNGIANLRREVAGKYHRKYGVRLDPETEIIACLGSKEGFSHMCLGADGTRRHRDDTFTLFSRAHVRSHPWRREMWSPLDVADPDKFLRNVAYTCEHMAPRAKSS